MTPLPRRFALALLMGSTALPLAAQDAPVRSVTLFEAGLAELTRETGAAGEVTLRVPLRDVNDVLKSLLVRGTGITGATMTLDGATPVEDAFASLPFPPAAATDLVTLLRSVPGLRVRVASSAFPEGREGTLMGVGEDCTTEGGCETTLTVLHDDGAIRSHVLGEGLDLTILDAEVTEALGRGLASLRGQASGTVREVVVSFDGAGIEDGALTYVVAAPSWKTAYRALTQGDGGTDLQAWAVIENATGEDWDDVALTLSSGSPVTLMADLHGRDWRYRETVEPEGGFAPMVPAPEPVVVMDEGMFESDMATGAAIGRQSLPAPMAAPAPVVAQATSGEGVLDSRFALAEPVDLAAGEMISLPFLAGAIDATHLSVWEGAHWTRTGNPEMRLEVTNGLDVRLPAGIMTVSDEEGGYIGDADFPLVAPGETEAVPFGQDRRLSVEETATDSSRQVSIRAARGVITIRSEDVRETAYAVTSPAGEARDLVIDHPLEQGWSSRVAAAPEGVTGEERQDDDGRRWLRVAVTAPEGGEAAKVVVRDTYPREQVVMLGQLDETALVSFATQVQDPDERAYLEEAATLAGAATDARAALVEAEQTERSLAAQQDRARMNLSSVPNPSAAYDRFLADLLDLQDRIEAATTATGAARDAVSAAEAAFAAFVSAN